MAKSKFTMEHVEAVLQEYGPMLAIDIAKKLKKGASGRSVGGVLAHMRKNGYAAQHPGGTWTLTKTTKNGTSNGTTNGAGASTFLSETSKEERSISTSQKLLDMALEEDGAARRKLMETAVEILLDV